MKLPNADQAVVPLAKIVRYLLSFEHRDGHAKAAFFTRFGFTADSWKVLAEALLSHARDHDLTKTEDSPYGTRYVIEGFLKTPDGREPDVRSVWFIDSNEQIPRFVTAYPL